MEAFTVETGTAVPLRRDNVDTDQIIPAVFLKRITRTGFGDGLFAAWRQDPDFVLNKPEYSGASILLAGHDFGTGSSREHAVWALQDYGFRVVISPRYGDIFRQNSTKSGLLAVVLDGPDVEYLQQKTEGDPTIRITVDLNARAVSVGDWTRPFQIDDYTRWRLLEGLDDIGLTLRHADEITAFEQSRRPFMPVTS